MSERCVLLFLDEAALEARAVERAIALANALAAKLHVVLGLPAHLTGRQPALLLGRASTKLRAHFCRFGHTLEIVHAALVPLALEIVRELAPVLVVVGEDFGAHAACRLADRFAAHVLIARQSDSDLEPRTVVISHARRSWWRSVGPGDRTEQLVAHTPSSVLLVPVAEVSA